MKDYFDQALGVAENAKDIRYVKLDAIRDGIMKYAEETGLNYSQYIRTITAQGAYSIPKGTDPPKQGDFLFYIDAIVLMPDTPQGVRTH